MSTCEDNNDLLSNTDESNCLTMFKPKNIALLVTKTKSKSKNRSREFEKSLSKYTSILYDDYLYQENESINKNDVLFNFLRQYFVETIIYNKIENDLQKAIHQIPEMQCFIMERNYLASKEKKTSQEYSRSKQLYTSIQECFEKMWLRSCEIECSKNINQPYLNTLSKICEYMKIKTSVFYECVIDRLDSYDLKSIFVNENHCNYIIEAHNNMFNDCQSDVTEIEEDVSTELKYQKMLLSLLEDNERKRCEKMDKFCDMITELNNMKKVKKLKKRKLDN